MSPGALAKGGDTSSKHGNPPRTFGDGGEVATGRTTAMPFAVPSVRPPSPTSRAIAEEINVFKDL